MPKISAGNISENRELQKAKIVAGTKEYVQRNRSYDFSFSTLAKQAGIPRTSLYDYFNSKDELLLHMLRQEQPEWQARLQRALTSGNTPQDRVKIFFMENLQILSEGQMELSLLLFNSEMSTSIKNEVWTQKQKLEELLYSDLRLLGVEKCDECAAFIWGLIFAARELTLRGLKAERAGFQGLKILFAGL